MNQPLRIEYTGTFNSLLVIDDDQATRMYISKVLERKGFQVQQANCGQAALALLESFIPDLILLDVVMPEMDGFETFTRIRDLPHLRKTPIIFVTAMEDQRTIYRIFENVETDYVGKPVRENELLARIQLHLELRRKAVENDERLQEIYHLREHLLSGKVNMPEAFKAIITRDQVMYSLFQYAESIAVTSWPVLITGETGTGKELVAHALHELSGRGNHAFVPVNVAGLDDNMFADTLFGHTRGAFTGADAERRGLIEQASKGTLFLDEIGDLEQQSQVKLLRLLQEREYYPLGSDVRKVTDARVVVATNRPLEEMLREGRFRRDLYYRLRTHHLHLPPLRERRGDLPLLLDAFAGEAARQLKRAAPVCDQEVISLLKRYDFPGNVRELESIVIDAVSRATNGNLSAELLRQCMTTSAAFAEAPEVPGERDDLSLESYLEEEFPTLKEMNEILIEKALQRTDGNQTSAAKLLGISRQALNKRLKRGDSSA